LRPDGEPGDRIGIGPPPGFCSNPLCIGAPPGLSDQVLRKRRLCMDPCAMTQTGQTEDERGSCDKDAQTTSHGTFPENTGIWRCTAVPYQPTVSVAPRLPSGQIPWCAPSNSPLVRTLEPVRTGHPLPGVARVYRQSQPGW